ncbi:glycosyltransferase family 2 protein [Polynucleobacter paneuropaeus]|nr:glycosyltransferase family 2 protein [Polynucleobacter paneuropaeus]
MNNQETQVGVVIPTFNRVALTGQIINSLEAGTYKNIRIILCDSQSSDGTQDLFREYQDTIKYKLINVEKSTWWTGAVNSGVRFCIDNKCDYVLIINDDIEIPNDLIESLMSKRGGDVIISAAQHVGSSIFIGTKYNGLFRRRQHIYAGSDKKNRYSPSTTNGCCLLIPAHLFANVGMFNDEDCPHLYGDTEFQLRCQKYGYKTYVYPDILIRQKAATNYQKKFSILNLFNGKGSPVNFSAYRAFGRQLFDGELKFLIFGIFYHMQYLRSIIKILILKGLY